VAVRVVVQQINKFNHLHCLTSLIGAYIFQEIISSLPNRLATDGTVSAFSHA